MAKSTRNKKRKKNNQYKSLIIIIIVLAAIIGASMIISHFLTKEEIHTFPAAEDQVEQKNIGELKKIKTPLEGTWVSNYDGAILTIIGLTFSIDIPSVDTSVALKGTLSVEKNLISFTNSNGEKNCLNVEGHYQFSFEADEVTFKLIKDQCNSRKERMTMSWFNL